MTKRARCRVCLALSRHQFIAFPMERKAPVLEMREICKRFPGVLALDSVGLQVFHAEAVGLIGENGAGKSTLMKVLGGIYAPDSGEIRIDGRRVEIRSVSEAIAMGIGFIHQELNVLDNLDVAGNVFLGREPVRGPLRLIDRRKIAAQTEPFLRRLGLDVAADTPLSQLSLAQRQMVEIAKALALDARILIMDEPTSSLTLTETERLLRLVRELTAQGVSVIYISHRLSEVHECVDRVVVLRDGRNAGELGRDEISHDRMVRMMVGRTLKDFYVQPAARTRDGYFRVQGLRTAANPMHSISFEASRGEILGFAGLVGAGRSEMAQAIFGVDAPLSGEIFLGDEQVAIRCPRDAIRHGIYLVPEDRHRMGLVLGMSVVENMTLASLQDYAVAGLIRRSEEEQASARQCGTLRVRTPSVRTDVSNLSGGNQQKVILGKWLSMQPKVLIFDEPTRGIDVGAKADIYRLMRGLADQGVVILMISSDMEEILNVSDRVAVMHEGAVTGILAREQCSEEAIMRLAVGRN